MEKPRISYYKYQHQTITVRKSIIITIGVFVVVAILINYLLENPSFNKLSDKADFELQANEPELAEKTLFQIISQDSLNIDNHYNYINNHFDIPEKTKVGKYYEYRDDDKIQYYYISLTKSTNSNISDIGFYGKGLIQVNLKHYASAISEFKKIKNKKLKYLNNSIGNAYYKIDSTKLAEFHFRKEIENKGNLDGAYSNLIKLLFKQGKTKELNSYLSKPEIKQYFPTNIEKAIYFKSFQTVKYIAVLFNIFFSWINIWGAIAAFIIMLSWIIYLQKIDIFESESWKHIIITVLLGMLFSFFTYPLSDLDKLVFGFNLNGNILNDFLYCVIGIGAVEEFVKIIPLLLMMKFTKAINEPFDYIKYASLSALGFAFVENLIYFDNNSLHIIHGRALTAVVSHMFDSSIIAYGIVLNKYKRHKNPYLNFILFFILASLSHGFYDFWLINESVSNFSFLTFIFLLISISMWNTFKNNALNHSEFYDKNKSINNEKLQDYLFYSLAGVLLFEYVAIAFNLSPSIANGKLISSIYSGSYLIVFLSVNLSRFDLNKGEWGSIKYFNTEDINIEDYERAINSDVKLNIFTYNEYTNVYLPNSGKIIKRITVSKKPNFYLVKLDIPKKINFYLEDIVLIRIKEEDELLKEGEKTLVGFYLIPDETNLDSNTLNRIDFNFCGWAKAEIL